QKWTVRPLTPQEKNELLQGPAELRAKQTADWQFILKSIAAISDPRLRALCDAFVKDLGERFRRTAAARRNHHARRGGLVEHTAQMMRVAVSLGPLAPPDRRASWRATVRIAGCSKNPGGNGAQLHRQSRCATGNVRRRLSHSEAAGRPNFRSGLAVAGKTCQVSRQISGLGNAGKIRRPIILIQAVVWLERDRFCRSRSRYISSLRTSPRQRQNFQYPETGRALFALAKCPGV